MAKKSRRFTFNNSAALYQALREQGVPEQHVEQAAQEVAQLNELTGVEQVRSGVSISFPDRFVFGDEVVVLSDQVSLAEDFRAKLESPVAGQKMRALGLYALRDEERATWAVLGALRDALDPAELKGAVQSAHQMLDDGSLSGVDQATFVDALAAAETRLLGGSRRYASGEFALPGGGSLHALPGGEFRYRPADAAEARRLEALGFVRVGDGTLGLPLRQGLGLRQPGAYPLPGDIALLVDSSGQLRVDPQERSAAAMEASGFSHGADGSYALPQRPGSYRLPGGARLEVLEQRAVMLDPGPHDPEQLEQLGFIWDDEEGLLRLPERQGADALAPGTYPLAGGVALTVGEGGALLLNPGANDPAGLRAQGLVPAGKGLLSLPTES